MARVTRTLNQLHVEDLEPHRFEDLVRQLLYDFRSWRRLEATGRSGGDAGFDARGWEVVGNTYQEATPEGDEDVPPVDRDIAADRIWLIQCKREKSVGPAKIQKYVRDIPDEEISGIYGIVFATASDLSKRTRDAFRDVCIERGVSEWHLWGRAEIEDRLYQPSNDHLLFAYFGISLRIRKRSLKTAVVARLATKRRAAKCLDANDVVLLRDATDDRYPYLDDGGPEDRGLRGRWLVRTVDGLDHDAIRVVVQRHFAMLDDDGTWDYAEQMDDAKLSKFRDPWCDSDVTRSRADARQQAYSAWDTLPEHKKAWVVVHARLPFDDILAIDEAGDEHFGHPHIYTAEWDPKRGPFKGTYKCLQTIESLPRTIYLTDEESRVKFFARKK